MAANRRVPLASLKYVNFHSDAYTVARRTDPIPQQTCIGEACARFQPYGIMCTNMGSDGVGGFQWKCEADLPEGIRFGRVDVNCEGWDRPGDTNILHGSCGLEYELIGINRGLERGEEYPSLPQKSGGLFDKAFNLLFVVISGIILYSLVRNVIRSVYPRWTPPPLFGGGPGPGGGGGGGGPGGGWGPGGHPGDNDDTSPPPPYSKSTNPSTARPPTQPARRGWAPGFWTGLAAGGAGAYLSARTRAPQQPSRMDQAPTHAQGVAGPGPSTAAQQQQQRYRSQHRGGLWGDMDSTGGLSGGGEMRRATGFGGTSVR